MKLNSNHLTELLYTTVVLNLMESIETYHHSVVFYYFETDCQMSSIDTETDSL